MDSMQCLSAMPRKVYRHRLSLEVVVLVTDFSKIHEHDSRTDYREAWEEWVMLNKSIFDAECNRLLLFGYKGDPMDKIFKAGRYYFRKKQSAAKKAPVVRRVYVGTSRETLDSMDDFIACCLRTASPKSPAACYTDYLMSSQGSKAIANEMKALTLQLSEEAAKDKLKKTFKNRYYRQTP